MTRRRGDGWWSWPGAAALVLAVTLGGGWCAGVILAGSPPSVRAVGTSNGIDMLTAIGGVLAGALATYVGASITQRRERTIPDPPAPEELPHHDHPG